MLGRRAALFTFFRFYFQSTVEFKTVIRSKSPGRQNDLSEGGIGSSLAEGLGRPVRNALNDFYMIQFDSVCSLVRILCHRKVHNLFWFLPDIQVLPAQVANALPADRGILAQPILEQELSL